MELCFIELDFMEFHKLFLYVLLVSIAAILCTATFSFAGGGWGYDGQEGVTLPADWGHVSEFCNGKNQSPIDIVTADAKKVDAIKIDFTYNAASGKVEYVNNGHSVTITPKDVRSIKIPDNFSLVQFHFHTLSEHTVDGKHYDMEMHLVHADEAYLAGKPDGKLAVLGVFINEGAENGTLKKIFNDLPKAGHGDHVEKKGSEITANFDKLLPAGTRKVYSYQGSLTTPGCNEIVSWFVFDQPITMSKEQIDAYRSLFVNESTKKSYHTNRPTQPLNGRTVSYGTLTGENK